MDDIRDYMSNLFNAYILIRGKKKESFPMPFWDVVVITASDNEQKKAFEMQITSKICNGELPNIDYNIIADPPGIKIGSGGSTFHVLSELKNTYGSKLSSLRVLLIHSGGYSQRLPSHSLCGKLFSCLPIGQNNGLPWQVLDLKLAQFLPLLMRMPPGIFVTASDDIVTFALEGSDWNLDCPGFTALGHPSSLEVGRTHGVYVLSEDTNKDGACWVESCIRVLQKPSVEEMRKANAIRKHHDDSSEFVYSDSAFFLDFSVVNKLLKSLPTLNPLSCETDVYGDFLQPLGTQADCHYISTKGVNRELSRIRRGLYDLLYQTPLNILVLQKSKFYHVGTIKEFYKNWCQNECLAHELNIQKFAFSVLSPERNSQRVEGIVMHSIVHSDSNIGKDCVLEQCHFEVPIVAKSAILNGCQLKPGSYSTPVLIPEQVMLFTCSVLVGNTLKWVCGAVHYDDDVKQTYDVNLCGEIKFLNQKLENISELFPNQKENSFFENGQNTFSLWHARLFPVCETMQDAFLQTLKMVGSILNGFKDGALMFGNVPRMCMADLIKQKSVKEMIQFRDNLFHSICKIQGK